MGRRTPTKAMRRRRPFAEAVQAPKFLAQKPSFLHPHPLSPLSQVQTPNQDQWSSDNDDDDGRLYTKPVVHAICCTIPGSCGVCACGTGQTFGVEGVG